MALRPSYSSEVMTSWSDNSRPACQHASSEAREYHRAKDRDRRVEQSGADPRITRQLAARTGPHYDGRHWAPTDQVELSPGSTGVDGAYVAILSCSTDIDRPVAVSGGIHSHRRRPGLKRVSTLALDRPVLGARAVPPPKIGILSVGASVCVHKKWSLSRFRDRQAECPR